MQCSDVQDGTGCYRCQPIANLTASYTPTFTSGTCCVTAENSGPLISTISTTTDFTTVIINVVLCQQRSYARGESGGRKMDSEEFIDYFMEPFLNEKAGTED